MVQSEHSPDANRSMENAGPTMRSHNDRLSLPFILRLSIGTGVAFFSGMALGLSHGSQNAGLRFRAENSHRFPTTTTGWYLYHKSKNYHIMLGGLKEGFKMGPKVGFWGGSFFVVEEMVDHFRSTNEFPSSVVAGLTVAGFFSVWHDLPLLTAARTCRTGLYGGLAFGLAQDILGLARGRRLRYVDNLLGKLGYSSRLPSSEG